MPGLIGGSNFGFSSFFFSLKSIKKIFMTIIFHFPPKKTLFTSIVSVVFVVFSLSDETPSVTSSSSMSSISSDALFSSVSVVDALSSTNSDTSKHKIKSVSEIFPNFLFRFVKFTFDIVGNQNLWHICLGG